MTHNHVQSSSARAKGPSAVASIVWHGQTANGQAEVLWDVASHGRQPSSFHQSSAIATASEEASHGEHLQFTLFDPHAGRPASPLSHSGGLLAAQIYSPVHLQSYRAHARQRVFRTISAYSWFGKPAKILKLPRHILPTNDLPPISHVLLTILGAQDMTLSLA
jgi:hypothetical protein